MSTSLGHQQLIERFYTAFSRKDFLGMADCYHDDIVFEDPAFGKLKGLAAGKMWKMLLARSNDLSLTFSSIQANEQQGSAQWIARYTFSATGRMIVNSIQATFEFKDGKISKHTDTFNLNKWFVSAFGWKGYLFGALPFLQSAFKKKARQALESFITNQPKQA
jgi:ketosteroid isomerase-like protein